MRVIHIVPVTSAANAGILTAVAELARAQKRSVDAEMWLVNGFEVERWGADRVVASAGAVAAALADARVDVLHLHGLWTWTGYVSVRASRRLGVHHIVSPRGMLMTPAFRRKWWKKLPYWYTVERRCLETSLLLHATSDAERASIARWVRTPITVVPNGAPRVPDPHSLSPDGGLRDYVLFLGRLHPIKNLEALLLARPRVHRPIQLVVAGGGEPSYVEKLRELARRNDRLNVHFVGWVSGERKWRLLRFARALVLPSQSENFGNVVLEALAMGTPVVASRGTPWDVLQRESAGLWVDGDVSSLASALEEVGRDDWLQRREHAKALVRSFSWDSVADRMLSAYSEAIEHARPLKR
jgi:glycosyltransferase involved in cell wall biosynthesis